MMGPGPDPQEHLIPDHTPLQNFANRPIPQSKDYQSPDGLTLKGISYKNSAAPNSLAMQAKTEAREASGNVSRGMSRGSKISHRSKRGGGYDGGHTSEVGKPVTNPTSAGSQARGTGQVLTTALSSKAMTNTGLTSHSYPQATQHQTAQQEHEYTPLQTMSYATKQSVEGPDYGADPSKNFNDGYTESHHDGSHTTQNYSLPGPTPESGGFDVTGRNAAQSLQISRSNMNLNLKANGQLSMGGGQQKIQSAHQSGDFRIGNTNHYQINPVSSQANFMDKRLQGNAVSRMQNSAKEGQASFGSHGENLKYVSKFGPQDNQTGMLPNVQSMAHINQPPRMGANTQSLPPDAQQRMARKMSVAAKSGQLQVFGGLPKTNRRQNVQEEGGDFGDNKLGGLKLGSLQQQNQVQAREIESQLLNQIQGGLPQRGQSHTVDFSTRQMESIMTKRQLIEQQREKKQELLKQLDMGLVNRNQADQNLEGADPGNKENRGLDLMISGISPQAANMGPRRPDPHFKGQPNQFQTGAMLSPTERNHVPRGPNPLSQSQTQSMPMNNQISIERRRFKPQVIDQIGMNSSINQNLLNLNPPPGMHPGVQPKINGQMGKGPQMQNLKSMPDYQRFKESMAPNSGLHSNSNIGLQNFSAISQPDKPPTHFQQPNYQIPNPNTFVRDVNSEAVVASPDPEKSIGQKITRKLEGGRPHKIYDYMFIQMSSQQFSKDFANKKIHIQGMDFGDYSGNPQHSSIQYQNQDKKKFSSPLKSGKPFGSPPVKYDGAPNLNGLVKIRAYDNQTTDELPTVQCNLLPTQLDHLKVLICEQEDKNHPKLTADASVKFEVEKQNQIRQYMEDIIAKLQQKNRRFKVTTKKKFVEDALQNSTSLRVASVYVIVVNREKTYDPVNQKAFESRQQVGDQTFVDSSSEDDEEPQEPKPELERKTQDPKENLARRSLNANLQNGKKKSMYDSDTGAPLIGGQSENLNSTSASSNVNNFKKLMLEKREHSTHVDEKPKPKRVSSISTGPRFVRVQRKDDEGGTAYKYQTPKKDFRHGATKIKVCQDIHAHDHLINHPLNVYFNQYNEFIKLVFKREKVALKEGPNSQNQKFPVNYALGLARALGLNLKRDCFSEQNLKSREHLNQLKERLMFCFWKKINIENSEPGQTSNVHSILQLKGETKGVDSDVELETIDSSSNQVNTPKSKKNGEEECPSKKVPYQFVVAPPNTMYKYNIGKGNNSIMIRGLFKNRYWWTPHDKEELDKCNFCWTQIKKANLMDALPALYPNNKAGIKNSHPGQHMIKGPTSTSSLLTTPQHKSAKKKKLPPGPDKPGAKVEKKDPQEIMAKFQEMRLYNKIEDNFHMNNKKALYLNMKNYYDALDQDVFDNLPMTFHVKNGLDDPEFARFKQHYTKCQEDIKIKKAQGKLKKENKDETPEKEKFYQSAQAPKNIWIIKPGENTNCGQGIQVAKDFDEIQAIVRQATSNSRRTCIVQKYIHNPFLINRRKFDIRTYVLMTSVNGHSKMYIYEEGYLRTSCREFSINNLSNRLVHLTNDAIQKRAEDYGKFEAGNKISYNEFQLYIDKTHPDLNISFDRDLLPQMNKMTTDIFRACHAKLDPKKRLHCCEVFGLDFMIDDEFKPYLIEVNTNPCLELSAPLLARLIPTMLENALKIGLDSIFLPPEGYSSKKAFIGDACAENRFQLFFDSKIDGPVLEKIFKEKENIIVEMDDDDISEEEELDDDE